MTLPHPRTVRARLTLFTMLVTGVLLALIVLIVDVGARRTLMGAVDAELLRQARGMANGPGGRGGPRRPEGPPGMGPGPPGEPLDEAGHPIGTPGIGAPVRSRGGSSANAPETGEDVHPLNLPAIPDARGEREPPYDPGAISRARAGTATFSEREIGGRVYRLYTFPILRERRIVRVVQIPSELTTVVGSLDGLRRTLLQIVLPLGVLLAGLASLLLVDRFLRPVRRIAGEAERIGAGDLAARLPVVGEDEFAGLATTLNGMLGRLESAFARERAELARQRGFTADASHELKTPLAVIKANAGLLLHVRGTPEEARAWAGEIDAATGRMTGLVNDMLALARAEAGSAARAYAPCELRELAEAARRALGVGEDRVRLDLPDAPVTVLGSREDLTRALVNLVENALKHSGATAPVDVAVRAEGGEAILTVTDRGKGIAPEHLPHLFDRFYRVDASRSSERGGTGLGLAIVRGIVDAHGGRISVESRVGQGASFRVALAM